MKKTTWRFEVTGSGKFPMDMLRYDRAYPDSSVDASLIEYCIDRHPRTPQTITLRTEAHAPTVARWNSFGWYAREVD